MRISSMERIAGVFLLAGLFVVFSVFSATAQDFRAVLTGQITDPSGAVIKRVNVTAVDATTGTRYTGTTSDKGVYYIPYVLPGTYTVTADAPGFKTAVQDKVLLLASQTFNQNFKLQVGGTSETVVVTSAPPLLETSDASGGTVIDERQMESLPLNGGQAYMLIGTTPGSQFTTTSFGPGVGNSGTRGWDVTGSYTIGGGVVGTNQFTLNGANITSQYSYGNHGAGEWSVSPNADTIQEVNVMTTTYDARYGRTSGGTVNTVTKGGTNQFHGAAHYGYEGTLMDANTFQNNLDGLPRNGYVTNQWWLTGGGPVIKNKLFFFFGFEGYRQSIAGTEFVNVPPAYLRPGYNGNTGVNFGLIQQMDPSHFPNGLTIFQPGTAACLDGGAPTACNSNHVTQTPFANDSIPGSMINPTATALLNYIPLPNIPGAANSANANNYVGPAPDLYSYNQPSVRVDTNLTDRTKLFSYFLWWKGSEYRSGNGLSGIAANGNVNWTHEDWVAVQDVTHTFSPSLVGDFKVAFNRFAEVSPDGDLNVQTDPSTLGLSLPLPATTSAKYLPEFSASDGWGTGLISGHTVFGNSTTSDVTNNYTFDVDFTKSKGAHTIEFGGEIDEFQYGGPAGGSGGHPNGDFGFNSGWTQYNPHNQSCYPVLPSNGNANSCQSNTPNGSSLASLYLGQPSGGGIDWVNSLMEGYPVYAAYFQDNWRVNPRLTLNLGFRYDVQRGLRERHNDLNRGLCLTCVNPITNNSTFQSNVSNAANIATWTADGINASSLDTVMGGIEFAGTDGQSRNGYDTDWSDVGPRFGLAFALNAKTVIRGGYGIMYSFGLEGGSTIGEEQTTSYTSSLDGGNTPTNYFQTGAPFSGGLLAPTGNSLGLETDLGNGGASVDFPGRKIPREQLTSIGIQRALPGGIVLDARYAGNFTSRLRVNAGYTLTNPIWLNGTATLAQTNAAIANPQIWGQQVPNPYYNVPGMSGPGQCGTSTTVEAITLMTPLSQYCSPGGAGLVGWNNEPIGRNWYNGGELKLTRRTSHGLSFSVAYTYSKTMDGDGYQNGWPYQDPEQIHWLQSTDRTHVFSETTVYDLPFGRGRQIFPSAPKLVSLLISDWQFGNIFSAQSGTPVGIDTGWYYACPGESYRPAGGTSVGQGRWFNTNSSCWKNIPQWGLSVLSGTTNQIRNPTVPNLDASLQKKIPIYGSMAFTLKLDAFNALNSVLFGGPNTNPSAGPAVYTVGSGWNGFGTVGPTQQNFPRMLQVSGKFTF